MTRGLRRIAFTLGAVLLSGGWGLTRHVELHQDAAGSEVGAGWQEGLRRIQQVTPLFHLFGVMAMTAGAGLMALTVPWRGERLPVAATGASSTPITAPPAHGAAPSPPLSSGLHPAGTQELPAPRPPVEQRESKQPAAKPLLFKRGA